MAVAHSFKHESGCKTPRHVQQRPLLTNRLLLNLLSLLVALWSSPVAESASRPGGVIVFDGDSVSKGYGVHPNQAPDYQLGLLLDPSTRIFNKAMSGYPVSAVLNKFKNDVAPLYNRISAFNIIAFHAGDNDIAKGKSGAQAYAALTQYLVIAHQQGWKVIVSTELGRPAWALADQAELADYNHRILKNAARADDVIDFEHQPAMNRTSMRFESGFYCKDAIHPSAKGYKILAELLANAVNRLQKNGH